MLTVQDVHVVLTVQDSDQYKHKTVTPLAIVKQRHCVHVMCKTRTLVLCTSPYEGHVQKKTIKVM